MTIMQNPKRQHPSWFSRFWAIVRYEMLWNIRKKKFIGILIAVFIIATLSLVVPVGISAYQGTKVAANPDAAITAGSSGFLYLLFAIGTAVNSISSEFESGTIVPLVTKPVSRTMIFLGKVFGVFIILVVSYIVLYGYSTVGSIIVYGPQHNLQYMPVIIVGGLISTFIWVSVLFAVGALSKNTITTVISVIILFLSFFFAAPIVNELAGPSPALNYFPGTGASGIIIGGAGNGTSASSGTDSIGMNIVNYALYSSAKVYYFQTNLTAVRAGETSVPTGALVYTEPTSLVAARSIAVAFAYVIGLLVVAWVALKKSQILE
jgi:ABC-type transport system involved in multi-copper enzyme maturation permease subunit